MAMHHAPRFPALRFMLALKAARDFGLSRNHADEIALRFNAREPSAEHLVDDLATTLLERGVIVLPDAA